MLINIEDPTMRVKCRTAIKARLFYFNLCLSVMLDNRSHSLQLKLWVFTKLHVCYLEKDFIIMVTHTSASLLIPRVIR